MKIFGCLKGSSQNSENSANVDRTFMEQSFHQTAENLANVAISENMPFYYRALRDCATVHNQGALQLGTWTAVSVLCVTFHTPDFS